MLNKEINYRNPLSVWVMKTKIFCPRFWSGHGARGRRENGASGADGLKYHVEDKKVLHVSLHDAVSKVDVWYHELFKILLIILTCGG